MPHLRAFWSYYVRSALPFVSGVSVMVLRDKLDLSAPVLVGLGVVLVVAGPIAIQTVLTLIAEALRGDILLHEMPAAPIARVGTPDWPFLRSRGHSSVRRSLGSATLGSSEATGRSAVQAPRRPVPSGPGAR